MNGMVERVKYPRTPHLPWSPGATSDDVRLADVSRFAGRSVVVTEKLDGENTTIYADGFTHARSLSSGRAEWRDWVRGFAAQVAVTIPSGWRVVGENMFAKHSIRYTGLRSYFYAFAMVDDANTVLPWDVLVDWCSEVGVQPVPVLWSGMWNETQVRACWSGVSREGGQQEGYVVRAAGEFPISEFSEHVAKFVRVNHVTTDHHWTHTQLERNTLA